MHFVILSDFRGCIRKCRLFNLYAKALLNNELEQRKVRKLTLRDSTPLSDSGIHQDGSVPRNAVADSPVEAAVGADDGGGSD